MDQIPQVASQYVGKVEPLVQKSEEFLLACVEEGWTPGTRMGMSLTGELISMSERATGRTTRLARGLPALMAWRMLVLMGATAVANHAFASLGLVLREPIEVEGLGDRLTHLPLIRRRELFHPETYLGHEDHGFRYIENLWQRHPHLQSLFAFEDDYFDALGKFLMIVALIDAKYRERFSIRPTYRLLPRPRRTMASLCGRLSTSDEYLGHVAEAIGESASEFKESWSDRVKWANSAGLGERYLPEAGTYFPDPMDSDVESF